MPGKNPYRPGVGIQPPYIAGRSNELRRFRSSLRGAPAIPANVRLTGLRGVGKTVLLREFATVARSEGWAEVLLEFEPRHNSEESLVETLVKTCAAARNSLSATARVRARIGKAIQRAEGLSISYGDVSVGLEGFLTPSTSDLSKALVDLVEAALDTGHDGIVLLFDEAQAIRDDRSRGREHPLSLLIAAISTLQRREVPLGLVLCGLPTLASNLLQARTYSERMFRGEPIGSLEPDAAREAFVHPLDESGMPYSEELVDDVLVSVEGYPYFIQLWGAELWEASSYAGEATLTRKLLAAVEPEIYRRLDIDFYEPRVQTLRPAEQDVLLATAACPYPPLRVADLNAATDKRPGNVNVLLGRLVEQGVLYRLRKGQYEYTAPKFYEFLKRRSDPRLH